MLRALLGGVRQAHIRSVIAPFVPLRVFSSYTMLEGAMEPKTIAARAADLGFPAVALADRNGLYGAMPFSSACFAKGVQPIIGAMLAIARPNEIGGGGCDWLALLAKDEAGYANLTKLVSAAHLDRPITEEPHVGFDMLQRQSEGLIALTAGADGALTRLLGEGQGSAAEAYADRLQAMAALDVEAAAAVVIEDSLVGVTAGLASGAAVVGVPSLQPLEPQPGLLIRRSLEGLTVQDLLALTGDRLAVG